MPDGPRVAITMGDPAGIGPEIVVKALCDPNSRRLGLRPVVVGDLRLLRTTASACAVDIDLRRVDPGEWSDDGVGVIDLVNVAQDMAPGHASAEGGEAAWAVSYTHLTLPTTPYV